MPNSKSPAPMSVEEAVKRLKQELDDSNSRTAYPEIKHGPQREMAFRSDILRLIAAYEESQKEDSAMNVEHIERRIADRRTAIKSGNTTTADAIRSELSAMGVTLTDKQHGTAWSYANSASHLLDTGDEEKMDIASAVRAVRLGESPVPSTGDEDAEYLRTVARAHLSSDATTREHIARLRAIADRLSDSAPTIGSEENYPQNWCPEEVLQWGEKFEALAQPVPDTEKVKTGPLDDLITGYRKTVSYGLDEERREAEARQAIHQHVTALVQAERERCTKIIMRHTPKDGVKDATGFLQAAIDIQAGISNE